jgi:hypothetical protein
MRTFDFDGMKSSITLWFGTATENSITISWIIWPLQRTLAPFRQRLVEQLPALTNLEESLIKWGA